MNQKITALLGILLTLATGSPAWASKIQQQGIVTTTDCTNRSVSNANCLPLSSQVYDTTLGSTIASAISSGKLAGGGGGSKNYLSVYTASTSGGSANTGNGDWELGTTTGWSLAHSSLSGTTPTSTATAGSAFSSTSGGSSASGNLSITASSSSPLQKTYSGVLASSAASTAGDMLISSAFYIDSADETRSMTVTFDYSTSSSTINLSGSSSNTFAIWIYDVTNGAWIQPAGVYNMNGASPAKQITFQATSNSTQYQLALININATSGAYSIKLDEMTVGPQVALSGPAMTDWQSYTPTLGAAYGTGSNFNFFYRRVGDSIEVNGFVTTGTVGGGSATIQLPSGLSIDFTKVAGSQQAIVGNIMALDTSSSNQQYPDVGRGPWMLWVGSSTSTNSVMCSNHVQNNVLDNFCNIPSNGSNVLVWFKVPVVGWSSNSAMSNDTDSRAVFAQVHLSTNTSFSTPNAVKFDTVDKDTHAGYSTSTGQYTVPVTGAYKVTFKTSLSSLSATPTFYLNHNGTDTAEIGFTNTNLQSHSNGSYTIYCTTGDTLQIDSNTTETYGGSGVPYQTYMTIERVSGVALTTATDSVAMSATKNNGSNTTSGTEQILSGFTTLLHDSHGAFNSSTGVYTCPVSGFYHVDGTVQFGNSSTGFRYAAIQHNSSTVLIGGLYQANGSLSATVSGGIECLQGDTIDLVGYQNSGGTLVYNNNAGGTNITIYRTGN